MIRLSMVIMFTLLFLVAAGTAGAEMAKEGSGDYLSGKTSVSQIMKMGKERLHMNYEQHGVVVKAPENSPFYNASFRVLGSLHAIKGKFKSPGFVVWTRPNGDKIYASYEMEGAFGVSNETVLTLVGGTGACTGIQGTLTIKSVPGLKRSKKDVSPGISVGTFSWKIP